MIQNVHVFLESALMSCDDTELQISVDISIYIIYYIDIILMCPALISPDYLSADGRYQIEPLP